MTATGKVMELIASKSSFSTVKKKLTIRDDDSPEITNQAREGVSFLISIQAALSAISCGLKLTFVMTGHVQQLAFVDRVKVKLDTSEYQEFLRYLDLFSKKIISQPELHSLVCLAA
ncbi:unnamed protein product [Brassica oleracea var. botrytis]|uniref:Uncharacterized protein n=1 Tax=Brassica oleracea TaxID=3712 RepID=A0A3P6CVJ8_BRAOL|nr:unnamed protein product [Brassica oleracea]